MEFAALREELAKPAYAALSDRQAVGALRAVQITRPREYHATYKSLLGDLDPAMAADIVDRLATAGQTNPVVRLASKCLEPAQGGINLAHANAQAQLDLLVPAVLTAAQVMALKALAIETVNPWSDVQLWQVQSVRSA